MKQSRLIIAHLCVLDSIKFNFPLLLLLRNGQRNFRRLSCGSWLSRVCLNVGEATASRGEGIHGRAADTSGGGGGSTSRGILQSRGR